jgi:xanthine dehydrogenase accessory factor
MTGADMVDWLTSLLDQSKPAVLITVAQTEGSAPREPGAKMVVTADGQYDTIGGGHLELNACTFAREMLSSQPSVGNTRHLERFALGPTLGQCCGGVVYLVFERIDAREHPYYASLQIRLERGLESWRIIGSDQAEPPELVENIDEFLCGTSGSVSAQTCSVLWGRSGGWRLLDPILPHSPHLFLFGAGHVGAAVVRAMAPLSCRITWIDEREDLFPRVLPANATAEATDTPEALVDAAPAGASFLVMTHSHALDQRLAEQILRRTDFGWFGLIGSRTKRVQFERRLLARGIPSDRLTRMTCPIGVSGIHGKQPAVIAAAVTAQLLQVWEALHAGMEYAAAQRRDCA